MSGTTTPTPPGEATRAQLAAWLAEAEAALHKLLTGAGVASVQYGGIGGSQGVTYRPGDIPALRGWIAELRRRLGHAQGRRRAIGLRFG